jgi:hypothetical protein
LIVYPFDLFATAADGSGTKNRFAERRYYELNYVDRADNVPPSDRRRHLDHLRTGTDP